jgi:hypothetical protein
MDIDYYMNATRHIKAKPNLTPVYQSLYDYIIKSTPNVPYDTPQLKITYSTNRTTEIIILENKTYLIYDQYLGVILDMLNILFINSRNPDGAVMYAFKLLAERFQILGYPDLSLALAIAYRDRLSDFPYFKSKADALKRVNSTMTQECFVIIHELMHAIIRDSNKFSQVIKSARSALLSVIEEERSNSLTLLNDEITKTDYDKFNEKVMTIIEDRDDFIEEFVCDELATFHTVRVMKELLDVKMVDCLISIHRAIHHLRLLSLLDRIASDIEHASNNVGGDCLWESIIRLHYFKLFVIERFSINDELANNLHNNFVSTNKRYNAMITNPVLKIVSDRLDQLLYSKNSEHYTPPLAEAYKLNIQIDRLTLY